MDTSENDTKENDTKENDNDEDDPLKDDEEENDKEEDSSSIKSVEEENNGETTSKSISKSRRDSDSSSIEMLEEFPSKKSYDEDEENDEASSSSATKIKRRGRPKGKLCTVYNQNYSGRNFPKAIFSNGILLKVFCCPKGQPSDFLIILQNSWQKVESLFWPKILF